MKKYRDLPMDLADGTIVAVAEERKIKSIFTLDHKDFTVYKPIHNKEVQIDPKTASMICSIPI